MVLRVVLVLLVLLVLLLVLLLCCCCAAAVVLPCCCRAAAVLLPCCGLPLPPSSSDAVFLYPRPFLCGRFAGSAARCNAAVPGCFVGVCNSSLAAVCLCSALLYTVLLV